MQHRHFVNHQYVGRIVAFDQRSAAAKALNHRCYNSSRMPKPDHEWMVVPPMWLAAMPVLAVTATLLAGPLGPADKFV